MTSIEFADTARRLSDASKAAGHDAPAFRSPPRAKGVHRSIRRRAKGGATVAVTVRHRPRAAVMADMIDGVIVANRLTGHDAGRVKDLLWAAVAGLLAPLTHEEENVDLAPVRPIRAA